MNETVTAKPLQQPRGMSIGQTCDVGLDTTYGNVPQKRDVPILHYINITK